MSKFSVAAAAIACWAIPAASHAAPMRVEGTEPRNRITVTIDNNSIEEVLQDFSQRYRFQVKGLDKSAKGEPISATMSGNLEEILGRLLRNRNFVIIRSPDNESGIQRVMILDKAYGSASGVPLQGGMAKNDISERLRKRITAQQE